MILDKLGILSKAQDLTSGSTTASTNQIKMTARDWAAITDAFLSIVTETIATGDGSDTYTFELRVATSTALTTYSQALSVLVTGSTSRRIAGTHRPIINVNVTKQLKSACQELIDAQSLADTAFIYVGVYSTISSGATVSINAALTPVEPPTEDHRQVVDSNVGIPAHCSAGS